MSEATEGPDGVAAAAFRALDAERWDEFVGWLDPEAIEEFRAEQLRWWTDARESRPLTAEDILRHQPDMPPEVVEYYLKRWQRDRGRPGIESYFADVGSPEELERLGGREMLTRRLARLSPRAKLEEMLTNLTDDAGPADVDPRDLVPRRQVIGAVLEGDSIAHIVYRLGCGPVDEDEPPGPLCLAMARRTPEGWRLGLDDGFFGLESWSVMPAE